MKTRAGTLDNYIIREQGFAGARVFFNAIKREDRVFDLGANIGATTSILTTLSDDVHAWEPDQENFDLLVQNASEAQCHRAAVIDTDDETIEFYLNNGKNKGLHSLVPIRGRTVVVVPAVSAQTVMAMQPTVMKIDIEAGEYAILPTVVAAPSLRLFMIELHVKRTHERRELGPRAIDQISAAGFQPIYPPSDFTKSWSWTTVGVFSR